MRGRRSFVLTLITLFVPWLVACGGAAAPPAGPETVTSSALDLQAQAAAEATAIIQRAQATALVLQAEAQAAAMVQGAQTQGREPTATVARSLPAVLPTPLPTEEEPAAPPLGSDPEDATGVVRAAAVELLGVSFAAEGAFIIANYSAPPVVAHTFWPGVLSITDEASGTVFNEVPLMPLIGPLIARPVEDGQPGYFMVVHAPAILRPGSLVTVDLAGYTFEHVPVQ